MKFHFPLTLLVLILLNGACATKELKSVDDYIESNNGTDYFMEDGSGLPILTSSIVSAGRVWVYLPSRHSH